MALQACIYAQSSMVILSFFLALATAVARHGSTVAGSVASGRRRSAPLRVVGTWSSTVVGSTLRTTAIGSAALLVGRFSNIFRPTKQNKTNPHSVGRASSRSQATQCTYRKNDNKK